MSASIVIVDYGMGNLGSVVNMLKRIGGHAYVSTSLDDVARARKLILPGVGAFGQAMEAINSSGLRDVLDTKALKERIPILGICLGMQLLTEGSEENDGRGLGWIKGRATRFPSLPGLKVPHMGWNVVTKTRPHPLTDGLDDDARFYFVHSYAVQTARPEDTILSATYGIEFAAAIQDGNIQGAQFHPEKSHRFGKQLLKNFVDMPC